MLAYPFWSAAYAQVQQSRLDSTYRQQSAAFIQDISANVDTRTHGVSDEELVRRLAVRYGRGLEPGDPVGRLRIPRIDLDRLVQQGVGGRAGLDPDGRPLSAPQRAGPLCDHAAAGSRRALRRRRPPHHVRCAVLQARQAAQGRPDLRGHALREVPLRGREDDHGRPDRRRRAERSRLRPRAHDLHAAVQRRPPPHRVGDAGEGEAAAEGAAAADSRTATGRLSPPRTLRDTAGALPTSRRAA